MWEYESYNYPRDELYHYGVRGMKWGVRRARKKLAGATTGEQREKAISSLNKHREKSTAKIGKLNTKTEKMEKRREKQILKTDVKMKKTKAKAAKARAKVYGRFTSRDKAQELEWKANKLDAKADRYFAKVEKTEAKIRKNQTLVKMFEMGVNEIDQELIKKGRRYVSN